jgi:hypothetical protein
MFSHAYASILRDPDVGKTDANPMFVEAMAKLLGDGMMSLPQTMNLMKSFPSDPLGQRQWLQQHYVQDRKAMVATLMQHAAAFPATTASAPPPLPRKLSHVEQMSDAINHYRPFVRKTSNK